MSKRFNQNKYEGEEPQKIPIYLIVLGIMLIFILLTYMIYIPNLKNNYQNFSNQYPLINPAVNLIDKQNRLINFQPLRTSLRNQYEVRNDYLVSLYFEYLPTGANISINRDDKIWPASLLKIPVAMAVLKKVQDGTWKLSDKFTIREDSKNSEFGTLYKKATGTKISIKELLKASLVHSDNTAHIVLLQNLNDNETDDVFFHLGLDEYIQELKKLSMLGSNTDNRITAKRYTVFFRSLYNATYLEPKYSQMLLNILKDAPHEYLSEGIPSNIKFFHKTGARTDKGVYADSGIVYSSKRPYVLTVMIQKKTGSSLNNPEANQLFKEISKEIYDYVSQAKI